MLEGRFFVSDHAVHRARQRLGLTGEFSSARRWLIRGTKNAKIIGFTRDDCEIWESGRDYRGVRYIVKQFEGFTIPTVMTIIPNHYPIFICPKRKEEVEEDGYSRGRDDGRNGVPRGSSRKCKRRKPGPDCDDVIRALGEAIVRADFADSFGCFPDDSRNIVCDQEV